MTPKPKVIIIGQATGQATMAVVNALRETHEVVIKSDKGELNVPDLTLPKLIIKDTFMPFHKQEPVYQNRKLRRKRNHQKP